MPLLGAKRRPPDGHRTPARRPRDMGTLIFSDSGNSDKFHELYKIIYNKL